MDLFNLFKSFTPGGKAVGANATKDSLQLRFISFNIRYATSSPFTNERPWAERAPLVINQLLHETRLANVHKPQHLGSSETNSSPSTHISAFICLQEVLHKQLVDVLAGLNRIPEQEKGAEPAQGPNWAYIGVGRDDGKEDGEYSPIIYSPATFDVLHNETVWLSPTPEKPSKGWGAGSIRIINIGVFEHKGSKKRLVVANTHLDDQSAQSRLESVKIILSTLRKIHQKWSEGTASLGVLLTGDFNSFPDQEAYLAMKADGWLSDSHDDIAARDRYGEDVTFTGFEPEKYIKERGRIDFIWSGPSASLPWEPIGYAVLPNVFDHGVYLSDHRAVVGDLRLKEG